MVFRPVVFSAPLIYFKSLPQACMWKVVYFTVNHAIDGFGKVSQRTLVCEGEGFAWQWAALRHQLSEPQVSEAIAYFVTQRVREVERHPDSFQENFMHMQHVMLGFNDIDDLPVGFCLGGEIAAFWVLARLSTATSRDLQTEDDFQAFARAGMAISFIDSIVHGGHGNVAESGRRPSGAAS